MPALSAPQLALLRQQSHRSTFYLFPVVPATVFAARINDPTITVGENTIIFDGVTTGAFGDIVAGMTLWVGTAPNTYNVARIRVRSATSAHIVVAENSDVAWADNYYLTVKREWLCWSVRQFISAGTVFKDFDVAFASQTINWRPVAMMGDSAIQIFDGNPTNIYFDSAESYPVKAGATIASRAWAFGDGGTSVATTPGNHGYAAAGVYYPTLTVTDSNGQTHLTRRIAALPNRADCYTAFECTSLEGEIDGGWTANFTVRGVSDISEFPDRAPIFFFAEDSYGVTDGSVGFPVGRENIILFGYIQASSVVLNPETSECTFIVESLAGQMARELPTPASVHDVVTPAAWDEGQNLNIFRSLFYLLKYQSTVFDIADVKLYNDTTLIKYSDFPEDSLWNMLAQFAQGTRLMRCGVTRTGRLVVARDPNLMTIASRVAIVTVCQLQAGDWITEVTIPQVQFPVTCFLCLSGISYDGIPANDPSPLFGMSPGHPPKEYGSTRQLADLALVDQIDANEKAGLLVGQDNNIYGPVIIPLAGNWSRAFDPAYQEYVQAPSVGFPTKRGTQLAGQYLIIRKVSVSFEWDAGAMFPTLTCEAYSYPDISTNGDCFTTDAPGEPTVPPIIIIPPPPPVLTEDFASFFSFVVSCLSGTSRILVNMSFSGTGTYTYYLERALSATGPWTVIAIQASNSYLDTAITPLRTYYYRTRVLVGDFFTAYSAVSNRTALFCVPVLSISTPTCSDIQLDWTNVSGESGYQIERSLTTATGFSLIATVGANVLTYTDTPSPAGRFYYRVRAINIYGASAYSNEVTACGGVGAIDFPQHVIVTTDGEVWETFDFGKADACQPTWVDITGPIVGTPILQWDGVATLRALVGGMIYTRPVSGGTWTPIAASSQDYALSAGFWQNIYDPNSAFPGQDPTEHYTPTTSIIFQNFVGQHAVIFHTMGLVSHSRCSGIEDCTGAVLWLGNPVQGLYRNTGAEVLWSEGQWAGVTSIQGHYSKHPNEPFYASINPHFPDADHDLINSITANAHCVVTMDGPVECPAVKSGSGVIVEGNVVYHNTAKLYYWHSDPNDSSIVWIWSDGGPLRKSINGGASFVDTPFNVLGREGTIDWVWQASSPAAIIRAAFSADDDPEEETNSGYTGFYESLDGGSTWTLYDGRMICNPGDPGRFSLWNVATYPDCMLMAAGDLGIGPWNTYLGASEDNGLQWFGKADTLPGGGIRQTWIDPNS